MPRKLVRGRSRKVGAATYHLLPVDNRPLQQEAWRVYTAARKRLERVQAEVKRFEEEDVPAFRRWLYSTFPTLVSNIREAALQLVTKETLIEDVRREARLTGSTAAAVWERRKKGKPAEADAEEAADKTANQADWDEDESEDDEWDDFMRSHGLDPDADDTSAMGEVPSGRGSKAERETQEAADIKQLYRQLVQRLHPDNGGDWTPRRAELWHQVQQAWADRDEHRLRRLSEQVEGNDELTPSSPVGTLKQAAKRAARARWGAEHSLKAYKMRREWRFATREPSDADRRRQQQELEYELARLRSEVATADETLRRWDELITIHVPRGMARSRRRAS